MFISYRRVTDEVSSSNASHVIITRAHTYLFELPGLVSSLDGALGKYLLLSLNDGNQH